MAALLPTLCKINDPHVNCRTSLITEWVPCQPGMPKLFFFFSPLGELKQKASTYCVVLLRCKWSRVTSRAKSHAQIINHVIISVMERAHSA